MDIHHCSTAKSSKAISEIIKICFENNIAVIPQGGNTSLCGANIPNSTKHRIEIVINSSKMNQILEFDIHNQTLLPNQVAYYQIFKRQPKTMVCYSH
ncbi:MAG: hypothetical protein Ct9H300mP4_10090 [Gammaproteobacteria bacterium]|nr:MAG: hypothetical protein Ct9H300mP4_10090 [Gammaproteobacteria bacterium]